MRTETSVPRLLGDVGGTNARLAWQAGPGQPLQDVRALPTSDHPTLEAAIRYYLASGGHPWPKALAFGIATPVQGDQVRMTNHAWAFSIQALQAALGLDRVVVLNDFTALALALPDLGPTQRRAVGPVSAAPTGPRSPVGLIGPGTGLGVSGLLPVGEQGWLPIAGEGGHVSLAPADEREFRVLAWLTARHGHASAERAISGAGLEDLYHALAELQGIAGIQRLPAAEISRRGFAGEDPLCRAALDLMCAWLGSVAGNLALTLGARAGVYLGGGILPRLGGLLDASAFRARFEAKGRFAPWLAQVPTWLIVAESSPALWGAARALDG